LKDLGKKVASRGNRPVSDLRQKRCSINGGHIGPPSPQGMTLAALTHH